MQTEPLKPKYEQLLRDFYTQLRAIHIDQLERKWITISLVGDRSFCRHHHD